MGPDVDNDPNTTDYYGTGYQQRKFFGKKRKLRRRWEAPKAPTAADARQRASADYNFLAGTGFRGEQSPQAMGRRAQEAATRQSLALARSGRGAAGEATGLRQAMLMSPQAAALGAEAQLAGEQYQAGLRQRALGGAQAEQRFDQEFALKQQAALMEMNRSDKEKKKNKNLWGPVLGIAGTVAGSYFGPAGAMAGGTLMSSVGGKIDDGSLSDARAKEAIARNSELKQMLSVMQRRDRPSLEGVRPPRDVPELERKSVSPGTPPPEGPPAQGAPARSAETAADREARKNAEAAQYMQAFANVLGDRSPGASGPQAPPAQGAPAQAPPPGSAETEEAREARKNAEAAQYMQAFANVLSDRQAKKVEQENSKLERQLEQYGGFGQERRAPARGADWMRPGEQSIEGEMRTRRMFGLPTGDQEFARDYARTRERTQRDFGVSPETLGTTPEASTAAGRQAILDDIARERDAAQFEALVGRPEPRGARGAPSGAPRRAAPPTPTRQAARSEVIPFDQWGRGPLVDEPSRAAGAPAPAPAPAEAYQTRAAPGDRLSVAEKQALAETIGGLGTTPAEQAAKEAALIQAARIERQREKDAQELAAYQSLGGAAYLRKQQEIRDRYGFDEDYTPQGYTPAGVGLITSDERGKHRGSHMGSHMGGDRASDIFRQTPGYAYEYKDEYQDEPGAGRGPHYGIMAQDLERTEEGDAAVIEDERGMKHVDTDKLTMMQSAALHEILQRLDQLEGRRRHG